MLPLTLYPRSLKAWAYYYLSVRVNQQEAMSRDALGKDDSHMPGQVIWAVNYSMWRCVWWGVFSGYFVVCRWFPVIGLRLASFPLVWTAFSHLHFHPSSGHALTFPPSPLCVYVCVYSFTSFYYFACVLCVWVGGWLCEWVSINLLSIVSVKSTFDSNCVATASWFLPCSDWTRILHTHTMSGHTSCRITVQI